MMDATGSPTRNQQPLLREEESLRGPRMGAYRPPPAASAPEPHDLHLTADGDDGMGSGSAGMAGDFSSSPVVLPPPTFPPPAEGDAEYQLPPLISYCSYVRYGCAFSKWPILVVIGNVIAYGVCFRGQGYYRQFRFNNNYYYDGSSSQWPFDSWRGGMLALVWFATSIWLYLSAKVVDRDVQYVDTTAQYELGSLNENNDGVHNVGGAAGAAPAASRALNFEHVYGQVSRKLDSFFHTKSSSAATASHPASSPPPEGTSSLVNLSFALWAIVLGAAVFLGTGTGIGSLYADDACDTTNLPNATDGKFKGKDYQDMANFPQAVQEWIADFDSDRYYSTYMDDSSYDDRYVPQNDHPFPTAHTSDYGAVAAMTGGNTTFFAAKPPPTKNGANPDDVTPSFSDVRKMVLAESGSGGVKYYKDIVNPRMFLPIESTVSTDANGDRVAAQYCFSSAKDPEEKKKTKNRSWENIIRTTNIHCIVKTKGEDTDKDAFEFLKTSIVWKDKSYNSPELRAASSGGLLLVGHIGSDEQNMNEEVVSIDPSKGMQTKSVYHLTKSQNEYWGGYGSSDTLNSQCVQKHVMPYSVVASLVVLVLCGLWLILREGVAAGVVPIMFTGVAIIRAFVGEYSNGAGHLCLTAGTLFFHFVLCCGSDGIMRNICHLPTWIGRDMYIWSLYSWILSFLFVDVIFRMGGITWWSLAFLMGSGILLDHPVGQVMGYFSVVPGILGLMLWPFFGRYGGDLMFSVVWIIVGFGLIGVANFFASNRRLCAAVCRPCSRAGRSMMYGSHHAMPAAIPAATVVATV